MTLQSFLALLGDPLCGGDSGSIHEDIFSVLTHRPPVRNLGFIDRTVSTLSLPVNGHEFTIHQSPQILRSDRAGGTTGAVLWSLTPVLASYLGSLTTPLALHGILTSQSTVLELGSGVSSIVALSLAIAPSIVRPARILLSDQEYVLKIARRNLEENLHLAGHWQKVREDVRPTYISYHVTTSSAMKGDRIANKRSRRSATKRITNGPINPAPIYPLVGSATSSDPRTPLTVDLISLDWEQDSLRHHPAFAHSPIPGYISLVLAVDCIYNESLVPHLIETCVEACSLSIPTGRTHTPKDTDKNETLVMIALELRSPEVLEFFLEGFSRRFRVWRVPDGLLSKELRTGADGQNDEVGSGYIVYCGVLKHQC